MDAKRCSLSDICPRCKQTMTVAIQEHVILRRCHCGYEARDMSGETKLNWHQAGLSKIRIDFSEGRLETPRQQCSAAMGGS